MGVSFEKFSFTKITTVASQEVNLTTAFQPKALILWTNSATGTGLEDSMSTSFGFSDGTNDAVVASASEHDTAAAQYINVIRNDSIVCLYDLNQAEISRASVTSFDSDGFTLSWTVNGASNPAAVIHGIAIGGTDITNVKVEFDTTGTTATGNRAYTGTGFQGDFMLQLADWDSYGVESEASNNVIIGCALSASKRWAIDVETEGGATMDTWSYHRNNKCMVMLSQTGAVDEEADFVSFDSDGYTLNWTNAPGFATDAIPTLLIKGGQWDVGTATQRDNTGSQAITTAGIDSHKGAMFFTHGQVLSTSGTAQSHSRLSVGGTDGTRQGYTTHHDTDATARAVVTKIQNTNGIVRSITAAEPASSATTQAQADFTSFSANAININWSIADTTDRIISWFAVGEAVTGTTFERAPTAENVTVADSSLTRIKSALRVPSTESTTVTAGTATRMISATRVPSSDSTTVADSSLTRAKTQTRVPTAEDVTVADSSTTRMLSATRAPTPESPAVSEQVTRNTQAFRVPSADTTNVVEQSLGRDKIIARVPSADSTTVADSSVTRMLSAARADEDTTTVTEVSLTRSKTWPRVPEAEDVTVADASLTANKVYERVPDTESTTVADSATTQSITRGRTPTAEDVTIDDSDLSRMLQAFRSPSSDSVTTSEDISGGKLLEREPTADSITVADSSLTRLLSASRQPTDDDVTIGEDLARLLSASRSPSSDSVTVQDVSTTQSKTWSRAPTAEDITVVDSSLTRMLSATRVPSADSITIVDSSLTRIYSALRVSSTESVTTAEDIDIVHTTVGQFNRSPSTENITVGENLTRALQLIRVPSTDSITVGESLTGGKLLERIVSADTVNVVEQSLTRIVSLARNVEEDTSNVIEASLTRLLQAIRVPDADTVTVAELQNAISHSRSLQDTITVTEPVLERIVTAIRSLGPESVEIAEQVFFQTWHRFVFDSVTVVEQLFIERTQLSGPVTYATPDEVRPLLGNLAQQRTDDQINVAIDSAYDEINRKTNRIPPDDWKDTEPDFGIIKKICRMKAAYEMSIGIKDFERDREALQKEIDEMFMIIEQHDPGGTTSNDFVISSGDETYALNEAGVIWSTRYKNLKRSSGTENSTTINPDT